jgi:hypothetical protein
MHYDGAEALYRVGQGDRRFIFKISVTSDGHLVRHVLQMQWPPESTPASRWTP